MICARVLGGAVALFALQLLAAPASADLNKAKSEPNLEKRSDLALNNAADALKTARKAYDKGDNAAVATAIAEVQDSVELAYDSLKQTGKNPRSHPKWFKKAEIGTRDLLRRMDSFQQSMSYADQKLLDPASSIQKIHDELLEGLMDEKRR